MTYIKFNTWSLLSNFQKKFCELESRKISRAIRQKKIFQNFLTDPYCPHLPYIHNFFFKRQQKYAKVVYSLSERPKDDRTRHAYSYITLQSSFARAHNFFYPHFLSARGAEPPKKN